MSNRVVPTFENIEDAEFEFGGKTIKVKTMVSLSDGEFFATQYLENFFRGDESRFGMKTDLFEAELALDIAILFQMTNLKMSSDNVKMEDVYASGLMNDIRAQIKNLSFFKQRLHRLVELKLQEKSSFGSIVENAISTLAGLDPEKIQEMTKAVKEVENQVKDSPLSGLFEESKE